MKRPDDTDAWLKQQFIREHAIAEAKEALGIEERFRNHYECEFCNTECTDEWSCACAIRQRRS